MVHLGIGDKVRIRKGLEEGEYYGSVEWTDDLLFEGYGEILRKDLNNDTYYVVRKGDWYGNGRYYSYEMLQSELEGSVEDMKKQLSKLTERLEKLETSSRVRVGYTDNF